MGGEERTLDEIIGGAFERLPVPRRAHARRIIEDEIARLRRAWRSGEHPHGDKALRAIFARLKAFVDGVARAMENPPGSERRRCYQLHKAGVPVGKIRESWTDAAHDAISEGAGRWVGDSVVDLDDGWTIEKGDLT